MRAVALDGSGRGDHPVLAPEKIRAPIGCVRTNQPIRAFGNDRIGSECHQGARRKVAVDQRPPTERDAKARRSRLESQLDGVDTSATGRIDARGCRFAPTRPTTPRWQVSRE
jgi:hypothetical protein